jgi:transposase
MMGERQVRQKALFYGFSLEEHVPAGHLLCTIDRFVELSDIRRQLEPFHSAIGRPSVDPELIIRMLLIGYCCGIRSERRLCEEVHLNLAYRWFCRLGLDGAVPDHSTFSKNRHGPFRDSGLLRRLFEATVRRCMAEGIDGRRFDPVRHFRRRRVGMAERGTAAERRREVLEQILAAAADRLPRAVPRADYAALAEALDRAGVRTTTGRKWSPDNLRLFLKTVLKP